MRLRAPGPLKFPGVIPDRSLGRSWQSVISPSLRGASTTVLRSGFHDFHRRFAVEGENDPLPDIRASNTTTPQTRDAQVARQMSTTRRLATTHRTTRIRLGLFQRNVDKNAHRVLDDLSSAQPLVGSHSVTGNAATRGVRSCRLGLVGPIRALPRLGVIEDESVTDKVKDLRQLQSSRRTP